MLSDLINQFNSSLDLSAKLPKGIHVLNPFKDVTTEHLSRAFYNQYYNDSRTRHVILGINPGRLGAGLTGVPFADPINLEQYCGIKNNLPKKHELSSEFIFKVIERFGGVNRFYGSFYFTSVCPLGFTKGGKNINYYDERPLKEKLEPFIIESLKKQLQWGLKQTQAFVLGEGKNYDYLIDLNRQHNFFKVLTPLPHPRFIMQYKRKKIEEYIDLYLRALSVT
ncbi:MAG: uracil-DNA glycosylase family protein [Cytophagales bacterium]